MKKHIIVVEVTGEHIIKGTGGNGYVVDHKHLYIRYKWLDKLNQLEREVKPNVKL